VPTSPKRLKISLGGAAAGIFIGLGLVFFLNARDRSFYSDKVLAQAFPAALVVGVPMLRTRGEERFRRWRQAFEWASGTIMVLAVGIAEFYVYRHG
jgi:hypothetical protein